MKVFFVIFSVIFAQWFAASAHAGKDPIGWSLFPASGFPAQTQVGDSYSVTYTLTNNLPFSAPVTISRQYTGNTISSDDQCQGVVLAPNGTCTISLRIQPARVGAHSSTVVVGYGKNRVPLPTLSTNAVSANTSDNVDGYVTTPLPADTTVGNTYNVTFLFRNDGNSNVTTSSVTPSGFAPSTNTCATSIAANGTCTVSGTFTPAATGQATVGVTYTYSGGSQTVPLSTTTNVMSGGGGCTQISGIATLPLPASTFIYGDNVVKYTFTNQCSSSVTLGTVSLNALLDNKNANNYLTLGSTTNANDGCSGTTLTARGTTNDHCSLYVSVIPTATGAALSVEATIPFGSGHTATAATSEQVSSIANQETLHTVSFVNQCNYPVWYEFINGNGQPASSGIGIYSPDPTPQPQSFDQYKLKSEQGAAPSVTTLTFQGYENGKIDARTSCSPDMNNQLTCATASCATNTNSGACQVSQGAGLPSTAIEQYMSSTPNSDGLYDVSIINGMNVPAEFKALCPVSSSDAFHCTAAGALIQPASTFSPPLGSCSWSFTPPNSGIDATANYVFVSSGADNGCTSDCSSTSLCGTGFNTTTNVGNGAPLNRTCGSFLGYWTVADYIGYSAPSQWGSVNLYNTYGIGNNLPTDYGTVGGVQATYFDLYGCVVTSNNSLNSGFKPLNQAGPLVCGCENWENNSDSSRTYSSGACVQNNSLWDSTVLPRISWLKQACPTVYTWQFDDHTSQFNAYNQPGVYPGYVIVFCPGGKTGNPNGS